MRVFSRIVLLVYPSALSLNHLCHFFRNRYAVPKCKYDNEMVAKSYNYLR